MKTLTKLFLSVFIISLTSCNHFKDKPECINKDSFFDNNDPMTETYQEKVKEVLKITTPNDFRYFFVTFTGDNNEYLMVNMRNNEYCFDAKILVENWDKLAGMREKKGRSYPEELHNLKWKLEKSGGSENIVYLDMNKIID